MHISHKDIFHSAVLSNGKICKLCKLCNHMQIGDGIIVGRSEWYLKMFHGSSSNTNRNFSKF